MSTVLFKRALLPVFLVLALLLPSTASASFGLDWAWGGPPSVRSMQSLGVKFACRYLSGDSSKDISLGEFRYLSKAGISTCLVFETTASRASQGYGAGQYDAQKALRLAGNIGWPSTRPIYFAVDFDGSGQSVSAYFKGVNSVLGSSRTGAYAGYTPIHYLFDNGLIRFGWQTYAWSYGRWDPRAQLQQYSNEHLVGGVDTDYDRSVAADFGQWIQGGATPKPAPAPKPVQPGRNLRVGSKGSDVSSLQRNLNARAKARRLALVSANGRYGQDTAASRHRVAYYLGLPAGVVKRSFSSVGEQKVIANPKLRKAGDLQRAAARKAARHL